MQTRAFTSTMKLLAVALVAAQFLITGAHAQGNITASGANSQTCFANGACLYVGPLSSEAIDYWMVPQSLWGMPGGASAVAGEGTYYQNLSGYQGGSVPTGWELGLTFPVTATFTEPDVFLSGGIVCGFADICSYDLYTLFPASLNTYIPVLAIQGPAWVCIGPTGGLGCGPPAPTTCAQTNPPPPPPPTVQQLVGISNDAWFGKSGYSPYRVVGSIPASDGKSSATVYERGDPTNGGQIVIAAAGIAPDVAINVFADSSFTTGNASDALKYAVSNMADVVQAYAQQYVQNQSPQSCPASITLTGYSLGGAIAQIVGNEANNNFPTVTFGAPGVGNLLSQFGITSPTSQTDINYRVLGDQESLVGLRVGETITLFPQNLINFFAKYGNTPLGSLAMNNFSAFSLIYSLHFNPWLPGTLANAPSTPGDISRLLAFDRGYGYRFDHIGRHSV